MSSRKILVVDDNEDHPVIDDKYADLVDFFASLEGPESVAWSSYSAVFSHTRNKTADWADDRFEAGDIDGLFVFSAGEDNVSEYLGVYTLPRSLYNRRFDSFLKQYAEGKAVSECTQVFLASSFDEHQTSSSDQIRPEPETDSRRVAALVPSDKEAPPWCSTSLTVQTQTDGKTAELAVESTLRQLDALEEVHTLVFQDTYYNDGDGIDLLLHLRLKAENDYSRYPVYVQLSQSLEAWLRRDSDFAVLATKGVQLAPPDRQITDLLLPPSEGVDTESHLRVLEDLSLSPKGLKGRHDLANEWGPIQLWNGLRHLSSSEMPLPEWAKENFARLTRRRYYKYLFGLSTLRAEVKKTTQDQSIEDAEANYSQWRDSLEKRDSPIRLGLVEDEANKGWTEALNGLFGDVKNGGAVEAPYAASAFRDLDALATDVKQRDWDAVLVDLRLTASDQEASSRRADQLSGLQLIERLKQTRPDLPIVAVTASNKAWTAKTLQAAGADGYWIKESPEYGVRLEYTIQNAADLVGTLHEVVQRYDDAAPLWNLVDDVQALADDREVVFRFVPLTSDTDPAQVRKRMKAIQQRLRRAFGYLVMDPSDHEEEAFAFNRLDLAFLTTWSVLNEVAALYFSDPPYRGKNLSDTRRKHEFQFVDPNNQSVTVYWKIKDGEVIEAEPEMPSSLENYLRPTTQDGSPKWLPQSKDNPRIQWLLHRAGAPELALRMHDDDFKNSEYDKNSPERPPLRNLRNKLEESHGEISQVWHAELQDVHDLLQIWRTILPI